VDIRTAKSSNNSSTNNSLATNGSLLTVDYIECVALRLDIGACALLDFRIGKADSRLP